MGLVETFTDSVERASTQLRDRLYMGHSLGGDEPSRFANMGAKGVQSVSYRVLPQLFDGRVGGDDVLVDVGSGKGRVLAWWVSRGYANKMIGLELDDQIAADARRRLARHPQVRVVTGDAVETLPAEGTLFWLFNPFDQATLARFLERLLALRGQKPTRVIYYNARHIDVFCANPGWRLEPLATKKCLDCDAVHEAYLATRVIS